MMSAVDRGAGMKTLSTFYGEAVLARVRANAARDARLNAFVAAVVERAAPWRTMDDEQLWSLMFGATLTRSWMVWSNGWCPACRGPVPMYEWQIAAIDRPWKVTCPRCAEVFPKNDFHAFYRSGLDAHGVFDPARADRTLLFNTEHPDPSDPLHTFGVDGGEGYDDGEHVWRFIPAYLIYGQWKQAVLGGINALAAAYVVTGDRVYARKAGILLDRVADLYPTFDFDAQAYNYERKLGSTGYVSTWHDACEETRELALAYDMVFAGLRDDAELVAFLSRMAARHGLANPKDTVADIDRNIAVGLLQDPLDHPEKIKSNFPRAEVTKAILLAVQGWPEQRPAVMAKVAEIVAGSTQADGVTGEKGTANYSAGVLHGLALFLQQCTLAEPDFVREVFAQYPALRQTFRFHVDTLCLGGYYPTCGDSSWFAGRVGHYVGLQFQPFGDGRLPKPPLAPSMFSFAWELYRITGDPAYAQALYQANECGLEGLPYDITHPDPAALRAGVGEVIARHGAEFELGSVNKPEWHLAILRAGRGETARAAWIDYDWGGRHSHSDGMNVGLYAYGLDLLPDFGYPPVNHGGWDAPHAVWYTKTAAHHTVTVDGTDSPWSMDPVGGTTPLWAEGAGIRAVRASAPNIYAGTRQCERTLFLLDLSPEESVLVDIFRVVGGSEHVKGVSSHFGTVTTEGLAFTATAEAAPGVLVHDLRVDPAPAPGWSVEWQVEDRYGLATPGAPIRLRYTDLTPGAAAQLGEAWVSPGGYTSAEDAWVPRVLVRRADLAGDLASTFIAVIEPFRGDRPLASINRLPLTALNGTPLGDIAVAVELLTVDGHRHLIVALDTEGTADLATQPDYALTLHGEAAWLHVDPTGRVLKAALFNGTRLTAPGVNLVRPTATGFAEWEGEGR